MEEKNRFYERERKMMYILFVSIFLTSYVCLEAASTDMLFPEFVVLVPTYKNEKWVEQNLKSVCYQKSTRPYKVICVNDCSPDKTGPCIDDFVKQNHLESLVTVIHNDKRIGALANIYHTIYNYIPDHKVVVIVDGDDELSSNEVLLRLEKEYLDPHIWLTWGQFRTFSGLPSISEDLPADTLYKSGGLRSYYPYVTSHLRTFKAGLFKKIHKADLLFDGEFFMMTGDIAAMFPMIEMCAPRTIDEKPHCVFIPDVLYLYNDLNPIGDSRVNIDFQRYLESYIRNLKPYDPINSF
jgi:glycosyltransferase involved in cell wall biosynthesis